MAASASDARARTVRYFLGADVGAVLINSMQTGLTPTPTVRQRLARTVAALGG